MLDPCVKKGVVSALRDAIKTVAKLSNIQITAAAKTTRQHPLFGDEIGIQEEIINLEESMGTYQIAQPTLKDYPKIEKHMLREQEQILTHCIGLLVRMVRGKKLDHDYSEKDILAATKKLVRAVIRDAEKLGQTDKFKPHILKTLLPYMTPIQYMRYSDRALIHPFVYLRPLMPMTLRERFA